MYVTLRGTPRTPTDPATGAVRSRVPGAVIAFGLVSMLTDISSESVAAVLPLYVTAMLGMGPLAYGFLDGLYQGATAIVRLLGGWWADSTRRPKWVAFVGYAASAASRGGLLLVSGFVGLSSVVALDRLGKGLRTGPRDALIATASQPTELGRNFGVHRALDTFGALLGPLIAFAVLASVPVGLGGFHAVFVFSAAFAVLGLVVLALAVPDLRAAQRQETAESAHRRVSVRWSDLSQPALRKLLIVAGLLGLVTIGDGFIYLALADAGSIAAKHFPLLFVGTSAAYLLLAVPLGRLSDRIGRGKVFIGGHTVLIGAYALAAGGFGGWLWVLAVLALVGTFYAATDGVMSALASQCVPEQSRASGIAAAQTVQALARFVSSVVFGLLWQVIGRGEAFWIFCGGLVVAVLVGAALLRSTIGATARGVHE